MKYFLITIAILLLCSGCSYQNAFSKFDMTQKEELLASNTQSSKITSKESVEGIVTAIYLNNIDENYVDGYENFIVGVYMKDSTLKYDFKLNRELPIDMEKIEDLDDYKEVLKSPQKWDTFYYVKFKSYGKKIDFTLESDILSSALLHYLKDPR